MSMESLLTPGKLYRVIASVDLSLYSRAVGEHTFMINNDIFMLLSIAEDHNWITIVVLYKGRIYYRDDLNGMLKYLYMEVET